MKTLQIDASQLDINLSHGKKFLGRPFLISAVDTETKKIVGLHLSMTPPTGTETLFAIEDAQAKGYKLPKTILVDNAKDFVGPDLEAFCSKHGIKLKHLSPYKVASLSDHEKILEITAIAGKTTFKEAKKGTASKAKAKRKKGV
jgi:transposase InsO family protein